jgi:hypothetical protein
MAAARLVYAEKMEMPAGDVRRARSGRKTETDQSAVDVGCSLITSGNGR